MNRDPLRSTVTFAAAGGVSSSHTSRHWPFGPHHRVSGIPQVPPVAPPSVTVKSVAEEKL